jgi:predicted methyltransferase
MVLGSVLALASPFGAAVFAETGSASQDAIPAALASPGRSAEDRAQDETRHAQEFLEFAGVAPGMRVLDAFSAGGYYTELLSRVVGSRGEVIAYNNAAYERFGEQSIARRYAGNRLPNVRQLTAEVDQLNVKPASLDAVIFVMSYHDLYWRPADGSWPPTDPAQMLAKLHTGLKPGGVIVVQDHVAAPGGDTAEIVGALHRIDPAVVRRDFERAGFEFDAESKMLAHPGDDHSMLVFDPGIRGNTDQFVFRFRKPRP